MNIRLLRRVATPMLAMALLLIGRSAMSADLLVDGVPLPDDVRIAAASDDASDTAQRFLGAWVGAWGDGILKHVLIVERVTAGTAQIVSGVGDDPLVHIERRWVRRQAVIAGDTLTVEGPSSTSSYTLVSNTLTATFQRGASRASARLSKIALDALLRADAKIPWNRHTVEFLDTPLIEQGHAVRLETVIAKPDGKGPFPLLVVNHGSTGRGSDPSLFRRTDWSFAIADAFTHRGWLVAFPQRRGRGNSDGLYDEGLDERRERYSCDPDRSLPGAERALADIDAAIIALRQRPDVDPRRVVISGISRGGVLSVAYAGDHPGTVLGAINFVGGWLGTGCASATAVNAALFRRGAAFGGPTLWLYGRDDPYYSIEHSRANFETFAGAGGKGEFVVFDVPSKNGHTLDRYPELWSAAVEAFMAKIEAGQGH